MCPCRHQGLSNRTQVQDIRMGYENEMQCAESKGVHVHTQRIQHVRADRRSPRDGVIAMKTKNGRETDEGREKIAVKRRGWKTEVHE